MASVVGPYHSGSTIEPLYLFELTLDHRFQQSDASRDARGWVDLRFKCQCDGDHLRLGQ